MEQFEENWPEKNNLAQISESTFQHFLHNFLGGENSKPQSVVHFASVLLLHVGARTRSYVSESELRLRASSSVQAHTSLWTPAAQLIAHAIAGMKT